jgi:hypothetical protein
MIETMTIIHIITVRRRKSEGGARRHHFRQRPWRLQDHIGDDNVAIEIASRLSFFQKWPFSVDEGLVGDFEKANRF